MGANMQRQAVPTLRADKAISWYRYRTSFAIDSGVTLSLNVAVH